jgi:poly(3-hydroxybutyrate) depolymerase
VIRARCAPLLLFAVACRRQPPPPAPVAPAASEDAAASDAGRAPPLAPGCQVAQRSPTGASHTTPSGRKFHVWGPASYNPARAYPVVVTLHGISSNGRDFQKWFEMDKYVEGAAFVVYPDSKGPMWDVRAATDFDFFASMLDMLERTYCVDRTRVLAFGFSFGGKMAHHLGCKRPDLVKAVAIGDGSWDDAAPACVAPIPVLISHRTRDDNELFAWGKDAERRWVKVQRCESETEPSPLLHGCVAYRGCAPPGSVTFCEDTHFDPKWPNDWNHTVREEYRALTWRWFKAL